MPAVIIPYHVTLWFPAPSYYAFFHCADLQHGEKSMKLNDCLVTQTPGGSCIWLWKPLFEWTVCFYSGRDGSVSSSRLLWKTVKRSKPLQPARQVEQPCVKRAVFARDFHCFTTWLHRNLCVWPSCDLQFPPLTPKSPLTLSFLTCFAPSHSKLNRLSNVFAK